MAFLLSIIFVGLCVTSVAISYKAENYLRKFLSNNAKINNEKSIEEYKNLVRKSMHLTLAQILTLCLSLCIVFALFFIKFKYGISSAFIFCVTSRFLGKIAKLEEEARSLNCENEYFKQAYQQISNTWKKKALPDF
jgi:DMSO reductase anchor subunit